MTGQHRVWSRKADKKRMLYTCVAPVGDVAIAKRSAAYQARGYDPGLHPAERGYDDGDQPAIPLKPLLR
jgi:hypothetical protein